MSVVIVCILVGAAAAGVTAFLLVRKYSDELLVTAAAVYDRAHRVQCRSTPELLAALRLVNPALGADGAFPTSFVLAATSTGLHIFEPSLRLVPVIEWSKVREVRSAPRGRPVVDVVVIGFDGEDVTVPFLMTSASAEAARAVLARRPG